MKEFYNMIGMKADLPAFHLQTVGQTEGMNQKIERYLWAYAAHLWDNWAACKSMEKAATAMKASYDAGSCLSQEYKKGHLVWLDTHNLKMD